MKGYTLWFTGLPCSGKSTLAAHICDLLLERGLNVELLDGDIIRTNLSKGLTYSKEDRDTNIRRIGWVAKVLTRNGVATLVAAIAPYQNIREENRKEIGNYVEVYVKAPLEVLKERDVKGMYKKALAGEIKNFTGISDPYEEPVDPEIIVETDKETVEESVYKIMKTLELMEYIPVVEMESVYSTEQEEEIKSRLKDLGYI
jgi:adenylylsulfate kinase